MIGNLADKEKHSKEIIQSNPQVILDIPYIMSVLIILCDDINEIPICACSNLCRSADGSVSPELYP